MVEDVARRFHQGRVHPGFRRIGILMQTSLLPLTSLNTCCSRRLTSQLKVVVALTRRT